MIVLTAPTGDIGQQVLNNVLDGDEPVRVIARNPDRLATHIRDRVEVVQGSHGDTDVVDQAFEGADSVFWLTPPDPHADSVRAAYLDFTQPACDALKRHGVPRVVGISALGRGVTANAGYVTASLAMDDLIAGTGVNYRALTMPSFMDNVLNQVEPIASQGMFFSTISPNLKLPTCATRDIATVAAALLRDHSWTGRDDVPVLGPEDLSQNDMAQIMSEVLGKTVRYQQIPDEAFRATLTGHGMSDAMAQGMIDMATAKNNGLDNAEPRTPASTTPTTFRQWCQEVLVPAIQAATK
jgi:uncharacterized protein YbjT (DUF2867 family)